jgi:hypothetical protein
MWQRTTNLAQPWQDVRTVPPSIVARWLRRVQRHERLKSWGLDAGPLDPLIAARRYYDRLAPDRLAPVCPVCLGNGGPAAGDLDSDGVQCRACGE